MLNGHFVLFSILNKDTIELQLQVLENIREFYYDSVKPSLTEVNTQNILIHFPKNLETNYGSQPHK